MNLKEITLEIDVFAALTLFLGKKENFKEIEEENFSQSLL